MKSIILPGSILWFFQPIDIFNAKAETFDWHPCQSDLNPYITSS